MNYSKQSIVALISHIHTKTQEFTNKFLSQKGNFVSSHGFILYQLSVNEKLSMGELSRLINRNKSTTTTLVKKLTEEGLVELKQSETDSRIKYIFLTEKGHEYKDFTGDISKELLSACYKNFSETEKDQLLSLLLKMSRNFD
ncbi:MAG: MarR family winged helix-turn-helix transcriptional regulator [Treponema sp.]|nr:MarR family winged helix-turn-helix transcriptional regulator [Treponema sp.]